MAPFPEAEIMTIKRLEVALRKMDYKLLKDGAYKLHEKFHGGHKFEYLDLLEEILLEVSENVQVPSDIKDILCPTIEDILLQAGGEARESYDVPSNNQQERSISENSPKINAFDAFGAQKSSNSQMPMRHFTQSPFSAQPFKEFNAAGPSVHNETTPLFFADQVSNIEKQQAQEDKVENQNQITSSEASDNQEEVLHQETNTQEENKQEVFENQENEEALTQEENKVEQPQQEDTLQEQQEIQPQENTETEQFHKEDIEKKSIAIFYGQDCSLEKIKNINKLRKLLSKENTQNTSIMEISKLISEITTQADVNVIELQGILEKLKNNSHKSSLITNSQSAMFFELFNAGNIEYDICDVDFETDINLNPLYGLSNLFVCSECEEKYLDTKVGIRPLVFECPKCKNPMLPDFYAPTQGEELNMEYYNSSFASLANSKIWLLIHPSFNDKISSDMIEYAFRVSKCVEEVYILDKDINVRETYKYVFSKINPEVKIYTDNNALEDFLNLI